MFEDLIVSEPSASPAGKAGGPTANATPRYDEPVDEGRDITRGRPKGHAQNLGITEEGKEGMQVLWNRKAPQYVRQQEQAWHRIALEKAAKGFTAKEIAEELGCSPTAVQDILRQPQYQTTQVELIKRNAAEDEEVYETIKKNVAEAVHTLSTIMRDREVSPAYRIAACKELLDRRYGKPNQPVNRNSDVDLSSVKDEDLVKMIQGN